MKAFRKNYMIKTFFVTLILFVLIFLLVSSTEKQDRIKFLNQKIMELVEIKRGFNARAVQNETEAQRLQFIDGQEMEAKRHAKMADRYRLAMKKVQLEINQLQKEKCRLCKEKIPHDL